jgi:hypothetical protein
MQKYEEIKTLISSIEGDVDKFYNKGNKSAGTRIRKAMQDLKKLAQDLRVDVQETKSAE